MEYKILEQLVGVTWADFLKGFMCPNEEGQCPYDEIATYLRTQYDGGKQILPENRKFIFRPFMETPLDKLRVVILGVEPFPVEGYNNGLAFSTDNTTLPESIKQIYDAVQYDVYHGADATLTNRTGILGRPQPDGTYKTWTSQGVMLLNAAGTIEKGRPGSHLSLWRPFIDYFISNLWRIKRDIIYLAWGPYIQELVDYKSTGNSTSGVQIFHGFPLIAEHPLNAVKAKRKWRTNHFSQTNVIIRANNLGPSIEW